MAVSGAIVQRKTKLAVDLQVLEQHAACRVRPEVSLLAQGENFIGLRSRCQMKLLHPNR
jgi:hypothetical protein